MLLSEEQKCLGDICRIKEFAAVIEAKGVEPPKRKKQKRQEGEEAEFLGMAKSTTGGD